MYEAVDLVNQISSQGRTEIISQNQDSVILEVSIPMEKFKDSPTVSIKMDTIVNKLLLSTSVKDTDLQVNQVNVEPFNLVFEKQDLILINNNLEHYNNSNVFY